jgi:uncharacterized protein (DUF362 family)
MNYSRRFILYLGGLSIVSFFSLRCRPSFLFNPKAETINPPKFENPYMDGENAVVGIVGGENIKEVVREAVSLIGGLEKIDVKGKSVLVKPNVVTGDPNPTTTNPEVLKAVVELLYREGAERVIVGDMSALLTLSTARNMRRTGLTRAAKEAGAEVVYFEDYDWVEVELSDTRYIQKVYVSEWIYKVDRVVNLPVIKTHKYATYSICFKNFIGATHLKQRPYFIDRSHWEEIISEINQAYTPHLNIIDGTTSMVEGGPRKGTEAKTNIILASGDRIAADVVGLGIIKSFDKWPKVVDKGVWEQRQIKTALGLGLGVGKGKIELRDKALNGHNNDFEDIVQKVKRYIKIN